MKTSIVEDASLAKNVGQEQPARYNKHLGNDNSVGLIAEHCLSELLGFDAAPAVTTVLAEALMRPVNELTFNPGKRIRAQLVSFSYRLLAGDRPLSYAATKRHRSCAEAIELLHAGSLIIDDIEDGSTVRRGRPALHRVYGMSKVTSYWVWAERGTYYDMPLMNLVGWGVTGLVLFIILNKIVPNPHGRLPFALSVYLANFSLPLGFCILNGYWAAAVAGPAAIALAWMLATRFTISQHAAESLTAASAPQHN